jgi:hypothetical protein
MAAIEGIGPAGAARIVGARRPIRASPGFTVPSETSSASGHAVTEAGAAAPLTSMLALQEFGAETGEDREVRRQSHEILSVLAELQRALLTGNDEGAVLQHLAELAAALPRATDGRLAALASAIKLRVRVELARRRL